MRGAPPPHPFSIAIYVIKFNVDAIKYFLLYKNHVIKFCSDDKYACPRYIYNDV
jgi:hypothetical protein